MADAIETDSDLVTRAEQRGEGEVFAAVEGEITLHNSPALRSDLLGLAHDRKPDHFVLDLAGVPYMDSSAIAVLVELVKTVRAGGGAVRLEALQPRVRGLLEIARLESIFEIPDDEGEDAR